MEQCPFLERDRGGSVRGFVPSRFRATWEGDLLGYDLAAVATVPHVVDPLGVVDATVDENLYALFAVLGDRLAETVEAGDAVPFGLL